MLDRGIKPEGLYSTTGDPYKIPGDPYKIPGDPQPPVHTFRASVELTVKAQSKMEAAHMVQLMVLSSAAPIRDFMIGDFTVIGE